MKVETYDEYTIIKGFPENDTIIGDEFDHDESLDEIGAWHNISRKKYISIDETDYALTEPAYNNNLTEDDYHYMNRIIQYIFLIHTEPLVVAEIWKLYGILPNLENREKYLLKLFDIFQHTYYYDDTVDDQGHYISFGDRLFVDDWQPREWEHKDVFSNYSKEFGTYFFVNVNTNTPSKDQELVLTFKLLNNLAIEVDEEFSVDINLNGEDIITNFEGSRYPPFNANDELYPNLSSLLNVSENNYLEITAKNDNWDIIGNENIIIRVRGCSTADYYVSTTGNDDNDGSFESPFKTIMKALSICHGNKNIISIKSGEYSLTPNTLIKTNCTLLGCPNDDEKVIILNNDNNKFFSISPGNELILKNLNLQSEDCEMYIDSNTYSNKNYSSFLTVITEPENEDDDILFNPEFTSENPATVSSGGEGFNSDQSDGVWSFTNAWLSDGWSNQSNWECDFDLKVTGLRYITFGILCLLDGTVLIGGWENCIATTPTGTVTRDNDNCLGLLHGRDIYQNPDNDCVHINIRKSSSTNLSITKTGDTSDNGTVNYTWEELDTIPAFTIGARNHSNKYNFGNNRVMIKNLIVKKI